MSRIGILIGLLLSAFAHYKLFYADSPQKPLSQEKQQVIVEIAEVVPQTIPPKKLSTPPPIAKPQKQLDTTIKKDQPIEVKPETPVKRIPPAAIELEPSDGNQYSSAEHKGDFAGDKYGSKQPMIRIDWGTQSHALNIIKTGNMKLVILNNQNIIIAEVIYDINNKWTQQSMVYNPGIKYSDKLRIVEAVPAFANAKKYLKTDSRNKLAILIPVAIEIQIEYAKKTTIIQNSAKKIDAFGGNFYLENNKVKFNITQIWERT
ncbi:MAG: hypothetical protein JEZ07_14405 [Phycisphaerae bacterium]|nr:hypothetical protein [Phycisphaerae bacterium]